VTPRVIPYHCHFYNTINYYSTYSTYVLHCVVFFLSLLLFLGDIRRPTERTSMSRQPSKGCSPFIEFVCHHFYVQFT